MKFTYEYYEDGDWLLGYDETPYDTAGAAVQAGYDAGHKDVRATEHPKFNQENAQ